LFGWPFVLRCRWVRFEGRVRSTALTLCSYTPRSEGKLTDAEDDEENAVDEELAQSRLDDELFVSRRVLRLLRRPDSCVQQRIVNSPPESNG